MLKEEEAAEHGQGEGAVLDEEEGVQAAACAQRLRLAAAPGGEQAGLDDDGGSEPDGEAREMDGLKGAVQDGGRTLRFSPRRGARS